MEPHAGPAAVGELHQKRIRLDTPFARSNGDDFDIWMDWDGTLTVVMAEPPLLVPSVVLSEFPDLPDWARRGQTQNESSNATAVSPASGEKRRERDDDNAAEDYGRPSYVTVFSSHGRN